MGILLWVYSYGKCRGLDNSEPTRYTNLEAFHLAFSQIELILTPFNLPFPYFSI